MPTNNLITIDKLHFSRGEKMIFDGIDITIPKGKITVLQVFKTVLLNRPSLLLELRHLIAAGWL